MGLLYGGDLIGLKNSPHQSPQPTEGRKKKEAKSNGRNRGRLAVLTAGMSKVFAPCLLLDPFLLFSSEIEGAKEEEHLCVCVLKLLMAD